MAGEQSVAPKERINLTYKNETGGVEEQIELPNVIVALGDYGGEHKGPLKDRKPADINKRNFDQIMSEQKVNLKFSVADKLTPDAADDAEIPVELKVERMKDLDPGEIAKQVPAISKLMTLRSALLDLKTAFTDGDVQMDQIKAMLKDDDARAKLMQELGL